MTSNPNTITLSFEEAMQRIIEECNSALEALNDGKFGDKWKARACINRAAGLANIMKEQL